MNKQKKKRQKQREREERKKEKRVFLLLKGQPDEKHAAHTHIHEEDMHTPHEALQVAVVLLMWQNPSLLGVHVEQQTLGIGDVGDVFVLAQCVGNLHGSLHAAQFDQASSALCNRI